MLCSLQLCQLTAEPASWHMHEPVRLAARKFAAGLALPMDSAKFALLIAQSLHTAQVMDQHGVKWLHSVHTCRARSGQHVHLSLMLCSISLSCICQTYILNPEP